jgi:transcription initiation factor TFIID TATA-box-binding protein
MGKLEQSDNKIIRVATALDKKDETGLRCQNAVLSLALSQKLDLATISKLTGSCFAPGSFSALNVRLRDPRATILAFASGRVIITGARSLFAAQLAAVSFVRILRKRAGVSAKISVLKIENLVASASFMRSVPLAKLSFRLPDLIDAESSRFPGARVALPKTKSQALLFQSGRAVLTATTSVEQVKEAWKELNDIVYGALKDEWGTC